MNTPKALSFLSPQKASAWVTRGLQKLGAPKWLIAVLATAAAVGTGYVANKVGVLPAPQAEASVEN